MALTKWGKTEHGGHKGSGRKSGYWGPRAEAKAASRKARRAADNKAVRQDLKGGEGPARAT